MLHLGALSGNAPPYSPPPLPPLDTKITEASKKALAPSGSQLERKKLKRSIEPFNPDWKRLETVKENFLLACFVACGQKSGTLYRRSDGKEVHMLEFDEGQNLFSVVEVYISALSSKKISYSHFDRDPCFLPREDLVLRPHAEESYLIKNSQTGNYFEAFVTASCYFAGEVHVAFQRPNLLAIHPATISNLDAILPSYAKFILKQDQKTGEFHLKQNENPLCH